MQNTPLSEILPNPIDWRWATWRDFTPLEKPEPRVFDEDTKNTCLEQIRKIRRRYWNFSNMDIPITMTREEAHFWLEANRLGNENYTRTPKTTADILKTMTFDGNLTDEQCLEIAIPKYSYGARFADRIIVALWNMLPIHKAIEYIRFFPSRRIGYRYGYGVTRLNGFHEHIWPYLTEQERHLIRDYIRDDMKSLQPVGNTAPQPSGPEEMTAAIAAAVGGFTEELEAYVSSIDDNYFHNRNHNYHYYHTPIVPIIFGLDNPEKVKHHMHRLGIRLADEQQMTGWLAHTEASGLNWIYAGICQAGYKEKSLQLTQAFAAMAFPEMAPYMLALRQHQFTGTHPQKWLTEHPQTTAFGLAHCLPLNAHPTIPNLKKDAQEYLLMMKVKEQTDILNMVYEGIEDETVKEAFKTMVLDHKVEIAPEFTPENTPDWLRNGVQAIENMKKPPKLSWINYLELPQINFDGHRLTHTQGQALLIALAKSTLDKPHEFVMEIKKHASPHDLSEFSWGLFEHWLNSGSPSKERWAMEAMGHFGDDNIVLKLTPMIRAWPGMSQHQRAVKGLNILQKIGTDTALMQINGVSQKVKYQGIKREANRAMENIAKNRKMSREQLADRIIPDCGLDANGSKTFDYGPRQFTFVLTSEMKPVVRDEEKGKIRANLPKPNQKDDETKAAEAQAEWKLIKKQIREVTKVQVERLQNAMIVGRRLTTNEFTQYYVNHPLMFNIVQMMIWGGFDEQGELIKTFRVTDEHDYADMEDEDITLEGVVEIGVVHPMLLSEEERQNWGEVLSDYEIITPFQQLGRSIFTLKGNEPDETEITRFGNVKIAPLVMVGIVNRQGWERGGIEDGGVYYEYIKTFPFANTTAIIQHSGIAVGALDALGEATIEKCFFIKGLSPGGWRYSGWRYNRKDKALQLKEVNPVVVSEVLRDLGAIAAKGVSNG